MWLVAPDLVVGDAQAGARALAGAAPSPEAQPFAGVVSLCCLPQGAAPRGPTRLETEWLHLPIQDGGRGEHELESALAVALPFIRRRRECGAVLVHCAAGMSRSVAVAAAVLCEDGLGLREALQQIAEAKARALGLPAGRANEAIAVARELRACLERLYGTVARR